MADLSKVKISGTTYDIKDATGRTLITAAEGKIAAEETRAKGVEAGHETRITNLEARGRYLSAWNAGTGLPSDYPTIPEGAESPYTYTFKTGDYYIVGSVPASGTKYMPAGSSITATKEGDVWTWDIGKAETTDSISTGDQYVYSTSSWTHISAAKDVSWGSIVGTLSNQTDLQEALDDKLDHKTGKSGAAGDLAYADTASTSYTPAGSIGAIDVTPAGTITLGDFTQTSTAATLTKAAYTPAGIIVADPTGDEVVTGASLTVTIKDASSATDVTNITYESYTPAGTVSNDTEKFLKTAAFAKSTSATSGAVQISGTISAPTITVTPGSEKTFATGLTGGSVASIDTSKFSGGSFTGASAATFTQGAKASFTQGSKASLTTSTISYVESGVAVSVGDTTEGEECLVFTNVTAKNANAVDTFTANGNDTFTANGDDSFTANNVGTFTAAAISDGFFTANTLQSVETGTVHDTPSASAAVPVFTGDYFINNNTDADAVTGSSFTGTAADIKFKGAKYLKQEIDTASLSLEKADLKFTGTQVADFQVTGVNYDKATANGATFNGTAKSVTPTFTGTAATITVNPDA